VSRNGHGKWLNEREGTTMNDDNFNKNTDQKSAEDNSLCQPTILFPALRNYYDESLGFYFEGYLLQGCEYINPSVPENVNPIIKVNLCYGESYVTIIFLYVIDTEFKTNESLTKYCCFQEEIQRATFVFENGQIRFTAEFTSQLKLYINCCGIRINESGSE
jgi:hypothetical protein